MSEPGSQVVQLSEIIVAECTALEAVLSLALTCVCVCVCGTDSDRSDRRGFITETQHIEIIPLQTVILSEINCIILTKISS